MGGAPISMLQRPDYGNAIQNCRDSKVTKGAGLPWPPPSLSPLKILFLSLCLLCLTVTRSVLRPGIVVLLRGTELAFYWIPEYGGKPVILSNFVILSDRYT